MREEAELKALLFRDLSRLHANEDGSNQAQILQLIENIYMNHHAFDWNSNPHSVDAFAFFGPQQFSECWGSIIQPSGDSSIIEEAASPHHAWVIGALESAVHAVYSWISQYTGTIPALAFLQELLENTDTDCPFQGLSWYMDPNPARWHALLAKGFRDTYFNHDELSEYLSNIRFD